MRHKFVPRRMFKTGRGASGTASHAGAW
ncbi:hypothetical protein XJ28_01775 [Pseudomonas syringae pv. tomato]|nr:hypothetical protein XJ28_01775 [Pseudomonas syringae pv. tomato]QBI65419.1 DUF1534 domain-containing protein [Pseudomonas syringae]TES66586.1 DUF1534 domain-containing protein [Pseudomonas syringae pv. tomato]